MVYDTNSYDSSLQRLRYVKCKGKDAVAASFHCRMFPAAIAAIAQLSVSWGHRAAGGITWFRIPIDYIVISNINHSEATYKATERYLGSPIMDQNML